MKLCLMRYLVKSIKKKTFLDHGAEWQCRCIYDIFKSLGYQVDVLDWKQQVNIKHTYDVVFDITDLEELSAAFKPSTIKIYFLTGADLIENNRMSALRLAEARNRRGVEFTDIRMIKDTLMAYRSIELADYVIMLGNSQTFQTYPERYRDKLVPMDAIATYAGDLV